ncbi:hypothetical protein BS78_01G347800 [Paspalum vaginatum]|nr:hypothetical protein BS78_01G347800 [Paspalum vaginatum]
MAASNVVTPTLAPAKTTGDNGTLDHPARRRYTAMAELAADSNATAAEARASFDTSVWGDFFINYAPELPLQMSEEMMRERANQLKKEVSGLFEPCSENNAVHQMILVDTLQHLSIDHLFKEQIGATLRNIHGSRFSCSSLHEAALKFRLLREHGLWVSTDELVSKFRGDDGSFSPEIANDPRGLLSLYNAAHLFIDGEVELEEAILSTKHHMESLKSSLKSPLAGQVTRALKLPLPRTVKRLEALQYMSEYTDEQTYNPSILELAKLDFNLLQRLHMKELKALSEWWNGVFQEIELSFSRDRVVEVFFWANGIFHEEEYSRARIMLTKIYQLVTTLDDIYDVRATLDDSRKLTKALRRWDIKTVSTLPEYLRKFYLMLLRTFQEIEAELEPKERYRVAYTIEACLLSSNAYLKEAEFVHRNQKPTFEEKLEVSLASFGGKIAAAGILIGMGGAEAPRDAFDWALEGDSSVMAFSRIGRFLNDIASFNSGKNTKDVASSVECYMNQYNVTSEVAIAEIGYLIEDAWKAANQALFEHPGLLPAVQRVNNLSVCMPFSYGGGTDVFTSGKDMKDTVERLFVNPLPL